MLAHPFLLETRDGTLPATTFARWMRQDYLFVEAAIPFMATLLAKAPAAHRKPLADAIAGLHGELGLFRERSAATGVDLDDVDPSFVCHAYVQFLLATGALASYAEGLTVLYAAEKAYHDSWRVAWLEAELDELYSGAGEAGRGRMAELFELTVRYEIAFWELAYGRMDGWPGIGSVV
jgi:thiaminase/transcriptional activator TenA